jgi:hypothetical protein
VVPQLMPAGLEVTVPVPVPARATVSANVVAWLVNVAVTERACVIDTVQVPVVLVHAPVQPEKVEPDAGVAVNVTELPLVTLALHTVPQLMAPPATVPVPVPVLVTDSVKLPAGPGMNGDRKLPGITVWLKPGPCHDTARLSPPVSSFCSASM